MSLINDALKRAQEAQRKGSPAYDVPPMRPAAPASTPAPAPAPAQRPRRKEVNLSWFMPVLIILLVVIAVFFMAVAMIKRTVNSTASSPAVPAAQEVEAVAAPAPAPNPPAPAVPAAPAPSVPPSEEIGPAAIMNMNTTTEVPKPVIILQGVFNDPAHPWAIVNGKTVYIGDNVNGMRVTAISRSSITLVGNGQTNIVYVGR
jgi:hypothetical protein